MATAVELWNCEGVEGTTRRQQMARLSEWKKLFVAEGAKEVNIWEGGYGDFNATWLVSIEHESMTAFGAMQDKYSANSKSFDDAMEVWQKTPMLKFRSGGLVHYVAGV